MNVTDILLRSLMAYRAPMPPDARLVLTATALPAKLQERVLNRDLKGVSWRAWVSGTHLAFMSATRVVTEQASRSREMLQVLAIGPDGERSGFWRHQGGGVWELVVGA